MKLITCFMFFACLQVGAKGVAQKVTLNENKTSLEKVLKEIGHQTGYTFLYESKVLEKASPVTLKVDGVSLDEALNLCFKGQPLTYKIFERTVVIKEKVIQYTFLKEETFIPLANIINGKVTNSRGEPLAGVSVVVKGATTGTSTDGSGNYSIDVPTNGVLVFSYVGYTTREIAVNNRSLINIVMEESVSALDQVVVVGYGTQLKKDITGSVSNVTSKELEKRIVTKSSLALAGEMSGVSVTQLSGNPRQNEAQIIIRGLGTFSSAGNNPLTLIDGIESSIDNINPNDIESISVLKDAASASIYGSKAANGVILIETKKGNSGVPKLSFYSYFGKQKATELPQMVNSWDYAIAVNEADINGGSSPIFSAEDIQKFKAGTDPDYPNFNHLKYLWTSGDGNQTKTGLSLSGGTSGTQYLFSASYQKQNGIVMKNFTNRYDVRLNVNTKLKKNINLSTNLFGYIYDGKEPSGAYAPYGIAFLSRGAMRLTNNIPMHTSDGLWGTNETLHPEADLNSPSFLQNNNSYMFVTSELAWDIFKDLKISGKFGYTYNTGKNKTFIASYPVTPTMSVSPNSLSNSWSNDDELTLQSLIEYTKLIGDHSIHILGGFSQQQYGNSNLSAYRDAFPNNYIYEIDAGTTTRGTQGGNSTNSRLRSFFGRLNYSYLDKYLLEANLRYDGSSRFPKDSRFGLFPSISAGWVLSKEKFFKDAVSFINFLKIRGSSGTLGNQSVGDYPYQNLITFGQNYPIGGQSLSAGAAFLTVPNTNITWERTNMTDIGIDASVLGGKLIFSTDYFVKSTSDILYSISTSAILGLATSPQNAGKVENRGWDFDVSHKMNLGDFTYNISVNLSLVKNKVEHLSTVNLDIAKGLFVGYPINSLYGYVADGIFVDQADVDKYPTQPFVSKPGQIRLKDISGPNGVPDGKVDATYDRTIIGSPLPTSTYGLNMTANYKGFDLSILFQGQGGRKAPVSTYYGQALSGNGNVQQWQFDERWTPNNPNPNAGYPAMFFDSKSDALSTFWIKNATFLRLKSIQIGYNLPNNIIRRLSMDNVRFYVSGENLFTISDFNKGWDPEMQINQTGWYPLTRLWVVGINVNF